MIDDWDNLQLSVYLNDLLGSGIYYCLILHLHGYLPLLGNIHSCMIDDNVVNYMD